MPLYHSKFAIDNIDGWDQTTFQDGMTPRWDAAAQKFIGCWPGGTPIPYYPVLYGLDTSALSCAGLFGYICANNTVGICDSTDINKCRIAGVSTVYSGELVYAGQVDVCCTISGGKPDPGEVVFLAQSGDELNAAGKVTPKSPSTQPGMTGISEAAVGIVISNEHYDENKKCRILLRGKPPIQL